MQLGNTFKHACFICVLETVDMPFLQLVLPHGESWTSSLHHLLKFFEFAWFERLISSTAEICESVLDESSPFHSNLIFFLLNGTH